MPEAVFFCAALDALQQQKGVHHVEKHNQSKPRRFYARPANRSFEAYRDFLDFLTASLGGETDTAEDELREAWRDFWQRADAAASGEVAND